MGGHLGLKPHLLFRKLHIQILQLRNLQVCLRLFYCPKQTEPWSLSQKLNEFTGQGLDLFTQLWNKPIIGERDGGGGGPPRIRGMGVEGGPPRIRHLLVLEKYILPWLLWIWRSMINLLFLLIFRFYNLYPLKYLEFYSSECTKTEVSTVDFQIKGSGLRVSNSTVFNSG